LRAPEFWHRPGSPIATLLAPLGIAYAAAGRVRYALAQPIHVTRPVICVGNINVGGAGKTPAALALARWLASRGRRPHLLTRGYGGTATGPLRVDPTHHGFAEVGDEALLLAAVAPTWLAHDRVAGARAAIAGGADLVVMDDGLQNPGLYKDFSFAAIDAAYGFGNGRVMPAGPLREPVAAGLARVQAAILIGADRHGRAGALPRTLPVLAARLEPDADARAALAGKRVLAFAGIGRPEKFFAALEALGCELAARVKFPDHHAYARGEIEALLADAAAQGAVPVTTAKDYVRLAPGQRDRVKMLPVSLVWRDPDQLAALLRVVLERPTLERQG
jgi:tetraacyldisaccharide 4'-kinase